MENKNRTDIKIYGSGSSAGGKFNKVTIMGEGMINGDVDCINFKIYGQGELDGNLKTADTVDIKGQTEFNGDLKAKNVKVQGEMEVSGDLFADEAKITGNIRAGGDCNAEIFNLEGGFTIDGLLNADILKINLYWPSKVHEIGGSEIKIKKDGKLSFLGLKNMVMPDKNNELTADIIEGDDIYLENTLAKVVRGNNVTIGSGCKIEIVEYKENFKQDEKAEVSAHRRI
jgi:cytoskeletal protein CcmA (bactofilin family)